MIWYACAHGHRIAAALTFVDDSDRDLTGYFCPICMGSVVGHEEMIDSRILAVMQNQPRAAARKGRTA